MTIKARRTNGFRGIKVKTIMQIAIIATPKANKQTVYIPHMKRVNNPISVGAIY